MKKLLNNLNKNLITTALSAALISSSQIMYSVPSLTGIVTGLSRACAYALLPLAGIAPSNGTKITFCSALGSLVEKPLQIDDKTRTKLKIRLAPDIDFDEYNRDIYLTADALGSSGSYIITSDDTDRPDEKRRLKKHMTLPVNAFQKPSVHPIDFRHTWDPVHSMSPTGKLTEASGALLTDEDLDICCAYIKRDIYFEKSGVINRVLSKLPLSLALLPTVCTLPLYYVDRKLTTSFASSITKSLLAAPARIAVAAGLGFALAGVGNIAAHRTYHHFEEEKDKHIDQNDIPLFKKHLEATLKHVQSGKRVEYSSWSTWFDKFPRYRILVDGMQQESLDRRIKALVSRSKIDAN